MSQLTVTNLRAGSTAAEVITSARVLQNVTLASGLITYSALPTGSGSWDAGSGNTTTFTRNVKVSGTLAVAGTTSLNAEVRLNQGTADGRLLHFHASNTTPYLGLASSSTTDLTFRVPNSGQLTMRGDGGSSLGTFASGGLFTWSGNVTLSGLPTSNPGGSGKLWNDGGNVAIT